MKPARASPLAIMGSDIRKSQPYRISHLRTAVRKGFWATGAAGAKRLPIINFPEPRLDNFRVATIHPQCRVY